MKTFLVPTDFSDNAEHALKFAIQVAQAEKSKIVLYHCYHLNLIDVQEGWEIGVDHEKEFIAQSEEKLQKICDTYAASSGLQFEWINEQGLLVDAIEATVKEKNIDMVVMGTKGISDITDRIFGSNTADVVTNLMCPVLAVPATAEYKKMERLVYAADYHSTDLTAIEFLVKVAASMDAKLDVVHIAHEDSSYSEEQEAFANFSAKVAEQIHYKKLHYFLLYGVELEKSLEKYIEKEHVDLISLSTKHRGLLDRLFGKSSYTKKLLYQTNIPLLAFHYK